MLPLKKPDTEPIPGYRLIEPLGSGGFGEVWKCVAPGGLFKAIKFVHGNGSNLLDGHCPSMEEMRAIQRIKDVRHPFLLSMERVERCGEELVIVMELADQSLHELLEKQPAGLPRNDVLRYVREAAEVLDLMNFEYGLQHLDIKPRNLFLVRGHVKVADFGLVQSLGDPTASGHRGSAMHLSVVTPLYAAPELFQNKLSDSCDQYSLAIVYQELLTGSRPFDGKNVRQLMLQHTVGTPVLEGLPEADRPVIARALSKNPTERFKSCMAMVHALAESGTDSVERATALARTGLPTASALKSARLKPALHRTRGGTETRTTHGTGNTTALGPAEGRALPDYQFLNCLIRDPRGETWEARTAEGKLKRVQLLYGAGGTGGRHDPETLLHLQTLRHPALLPMTLVPSSPGCLLLVTDQIDTTLRQRYQELQQKGKPGISRVELLNRLGRAADALDQLYQQHGLQHLELNPSRLLLDGDRVLLDQIGIVQMLWASASTACSQTQRRYNAPERDQGLITRSCDQFSLAVIYQEMLTGRHPFRSLSQQGENAGRVLGGRQIDLQPLPAADRPVVARALETEPEKRFGSCVEFIQALRTAGARAGHSVTAAVEDPVRTARREQLVQLIEDARQWLRLNGTSAEPGESPPSEEGEVLEKRFMAVLPPEGALKKFDGFRQQWDARLVEGGDTFAIFHVSERSRSWLRWPGKAAALKVEIGWTKVNASTRKTPEVLVRVMARVPDCQASAALLVQLGPLLLESLQAHLLGSPDRRNGERILWPHSVAVCCIVAGRPRGAAIACHGKDLSVTGMGLYMPSALPSSQVQLSLQPPSLPEPVLLPGSIVRIQRWDENLYEVGVLFE
jgi:serine/threonine protein kinase